MPLNSGVMVPIELRVPDNSIVNPSEYAAVSSGNTEVSQRVTDVVFKAFHAAAASQGCMNVFHFNYGEYNYGETICGGSGAVSSRFDYDISRQRIGWLIDVVQGPTWHGSSGVHVHMYVLSSMALNLYMEAHVHAQDQHTYNRRRNYRETLPSHRQGVLNPGRFWWKGRS